MNKSTIKLTQFSHGAGCGCKLSPKVLATILDSQLSPFADDSLLVGHGSKDDAAAIDMRNGTAILSTTDFFMPIVDDPFDFGRIAATNAISDIYAMGGTPLVAIAILGWPIEKLDAEIARAVVDGGRSVCAAAGITLAGGHSIDSPEPFFGLAVTGQVAIKHLKQNSTATKGCELFLTKPLGIGVLTTAEKQGKLKEEHRGLARDTMCQLNSIGSSLAELDGVTAMTDVTGFGLLGHLVELCEGSDLSAVIDVEQVPLLEAVHDYIAQGCVPGGTHRNFESYGHHIDDALAEHKALLCDPQTSGGLLVAVEPTQRESFLACCAENALKTASFGRLVEKHGPLVQAISE